MNLIVNGSPVTAAAATLSALLKEMEFEGTWLATALNGELVQAAEREACQLREGDSIEILSPMQGG